MLDTATHTAPTTTTFAAVPAILPTTGAAPGEPLTMSSREIAELLGARHDNVKVTVERLANRGTIEFPATQEIPTATKPLRVYLLDKRSSLIVVAQLSPEFTARVVDRWQELEAQLAGEAPQLPNFLDPAEAAEAFAKEYRGRMIEAQRAAVAEEKLAIAGPKADAYDAFLDSDGLRSVRDTAKVVGISQSALFAGLKKKRAAFKSSSGKWNATAAFVARGYAKMVPVPCHDGRSRDQLYLTPKGVDWCVRTFGPKFD